MHEKKSENRPPLAGQKRFKLIACEIFCREVCRLAAECEHIIDVEFLRKGLHDAGREVMRTALQECIDRAEEKNYDAILLGYGRCNDGVVGLRAQRTVLVVPRLHDCIGAFFGSRAAYQAYFDTHPGTYFKTTGWTERDQYGDDSVMVQLGLNQTYDEYVAKYGKDNADYLMQELGDWDRHYKYLTYIAMNSPLDEKYAVLAEQQARKRNLHFECVRGDLRLLEALLAGRWNAEEFLAVPPGWKIISDDSGRVLEAVQDDCDECP